MSKILKQLYNGELYPATQLDSQNALYLKKRTEHAAAEEDFRTRLNQLDPAMRAQFDKILDGIAEEFPLESENIFSHGFRLGAKLMLTILEDE